MVNAMLKGLYAHRQLIRKTKHPSHIIIAEENHISKTSYLGENPGNIRRQDVQIEGLARIGDS